MHPLFDPSLAKRSECYWHRHEVLTNSFGMAMSNDDVVNPFDFFQSAYGAKRQLVTVRTFSEVVTELAQITLN